MDKENIVFLDTETTGLNVFKDDVMELAIVSLKNKGKRSYLFNKLLKPIVKCSPGAFDCHHITAKMVKKEKRLIYYYDELKQILKDKKIYIYNQNYVVTLINSICKRHNKEPLIDLDNCYCIMDDYAIYNGNYNNYHQSFTWVKLTSAFYYEYDEIKKIIPKCDENNIKAHRALGDCLMSKYIYMSSWEKIQKGINETDEQQLYHHYSNKY